jgi:radical SAM protein with 4Fe4S-binding SPASM domain
MTDTINKKRNFKKCYMRYLVPNIGPDGQVYACCELRGFKPIGNIQHNHLKDIWGSIEHQNVLEFLDKNIDACPACKYAAGNEIIEKFFIDNLAHKEFL